MRAEIAATAERTQAIARLIEQRRDAACDLGAQIAAGMKKPPASEQFNELTRAIARLVGGKREDGRIATNS